MQARTNLIEYNLREAAHILGISASELLKGVQSGQLRYFYKGTTGYRFHEASIDENRFRLQKATRNATPQNNEDAHKSDKLHSR